jgi:hypothetical protein
MDQVLKPVQKLFDCERISVSEELLELLLVFLHLLRKVFVEIERHRDKPFAND